MLNDFSSLRSATTSENRPSPGSPAGDVRTFCRWCCRPRARRCAARHCSTRSRSRCREWPRALMRVAVAPASMTRRCAARQWWKPQSTFDQVTPAGRVGTRKRSTPVTSPTRSRSIAPDHRQWSTPAATVGQARRVGTFDWPDPACSARPRPERPLRTATALTSGPPTCPCRRCPGRSANPTLLQIHDLPARRPSDSSRSARVNEPPAVCKAVVVQAVEPHEDARR